MTWKALNLSLLDSGCTKEYLFYLSFMGWPFQVKILFSFMANPDRLTLDQLLSKMSQHALLHFFLLQALSLLLSANRPWMTLFLIGSLLNINACITTIVFFKASTVMAHSLSSKTIATITKSGRKLATSLLSALIISMAAISSWKTSYQISSLFFLFFSLFCALLSKRESRGKKSLSKKNANKNSTVFDTFEQIKTLLKDSLLRQNLALFLLINLGHHLLHGWTMIYLKDIGFHLTFIAHQKMLSLLAYMLGLTWVYWLVNQSNFWRYLLAALILYSATLIFLTQISPEKTLFTLCLLFLKNCSTAAILSMKYIWITSLCASRKETTLIYTSLLTISNIFMFLGVSLGGFLMSYVSWTALYYCAFLLNLPAIVIIAFFSQESLKKGFSYL